MTTDIDLSLEALERIKALAQKATPGPWELTGIPDVVDILATTTRELIGSPHRMYNASYIAALHPDVVLAMCDEIERLRNIRLDQVAEVAISLATDAVSAAMGEDIKPIKLGTVCPYCGYESKSIEDAKAHDGTCPKHPAVIRAVRLEKEADWLAREVSSWEHDQFDGTGKHIREVPELREAARKAVEEGHHE